MDLKEKERKKDSKISKKREREKKSCLALEESYIIMMMSTPIRDASFMTGPVLREQISQKQLYEVVVALISH